MDKTQFLFIFTLVMLKAFKYRIYPTEEQTLLIEQHFGSCRLVYNLALEAKKMAYSGAKYNLSRMDLQKQLIDLKKECDWLWNINSQSLQSQLLNLDVAFKKFFKQGSGFPKFKSKHGRQSFQCPQNVSVEDKILWLPKFKSGVPIILHRPFKGAIKTVTISRNSTGKYFASILVETGEKLPAKPIPIKDRAIGIDVGLKDFVAVGNINLTRSFKIDNPKYLRNETKLLARRQRQLSRKIKGSKNRDKAKLRVARLHERILNKRKDFTNKISYRLVNDNQVNTICIEDLNVKGMMKNHKLARAIGDVAWGELFRQLKYKSDWVGKNLLVADRFSATSKDCHKCGYKNNSLALSDRVWDCPICGTHHDRDENAVPNIITSAFLKYNKNRDGLPELTLGESLPLLPAKNRKRKARTKSQEKFRDNSVLPLVSS